MPWSKHDQHRQRVRHPPVHPGQRDGSAPPDDLDGIHQRGQPVDSDLAQQRLGEILGQQPGHLLGHLGAGRAVGLRAHRVDDRVRAPAAREVADGRRHVVARRAVDDGDPMPTGHLQPLGHLVDGVDGGAVVGGDTGAHLPDGAETQPAHRPALGYLGELDRLPGGGQHVGEEQETLVRWALRHLDGAEMGLRDPEVSGPAPGDMTVKLGGAEARRVDEPEPGADDHRLRLEVQLLLHVLEVTNGAPPRPGHSHERQPNRY